MSEGERVRGRESDDPKNESPESDHRMSSSVLGALTSLGEGEDKSDGKRVVDQDELV
jgi:hypothetical protein